MRRPKSATRGSWSRLLVSRTVHRNKTTTYCVKYMGDNKKYKTVVGKGQTLLEAIQDFDRYNSVTDRDISVMKGQIS